MERMTSEQLEAIRKRAEAASEGPWGVVEFNEGEYAIYREDGEECVGNAEFITGARTDIPALLAEVEIIEAGYERKCRRLSDTIAELQSAYDDMTSIALWSARRVHKTHKDFAYDAIEANIGEEVERL